MRSRVDCALPSATRHTTRSLDQLRQTRHVAEEAVNERAALERDLHDGAAQRVLSLQMGLAQARIRCRLSQRWELHWGNSSGTHNSCTDDLRELSHGIFPSVLVDCGVVEALAEATLADEPAREDLEDDREDPASPRARPVLHGASKRFKTCWLMQALGQSQQWTFRRPPTLSCVASVTTASASISMDLRATVLGSRACKNE